MTTGNLPSDAPTSVLSPRRDDRTPTWRRALASLVAVALCGVALVGCTITELLPTCEQAVVVSFRGLDLSRSPSASVWLNESRHCKEAVPLDNAAYARDPRGSPCRLLGTGELVIPIPVEGPVTVTVRLNYDETPGPSRTFDVDFDDVDPDANGCQRASVLF